MIIHQDFLREYPSGRLDRETFFDYYRRFHPTDEENVRFVEFVETTDTSS